MRYSSGGTKNLSLRSAFVLSFVIIVAVLEKDGFFFWPALCSAARLLRSVRLWLQGTGGQQPLCAHPRARFSCGLQSVARGAAFCHQDVAEGQLRSANLWHVSQ